MAAGRPEFTERIRKDPVFDAVVIGGGVNGIGVYRDLSLQGLRVLLVEKNDFCSGCSAASSRMIHGGLRYLENGEFGLVRESLRERDALLRNAPHLVRPLPTVIPIATFGSGLFNSAATLFGLKGKPSARGVLPVILGLSLYDWVTRNPPSDAEAFGFGKTVDPGAVAQSDQESEILRHLPRCVDFTSGTALP